MSNPSTTTLRGLPVWARVAIALAVVLLGAALVRRAASSPDTDWPQIREISHNIRRAYPMYEAPMTTQGDRDSALAIAEQSANTMDRTRDVGLTPSQRLYKYLGLTAARFFAAYFAQDVATKIAHLDRADEALRRADQAAGDVRTNETWTAADHDQFREARGHVAMLVACVRALQFKLGRATAAEVDVSLGGIPAAYRALHPPDEDRTLHEYLSRTAAQ